ncbi:MAG: glutamine synthetase, type [Desulfomicrobiaceae bacterium]|jgi:glutamine synthetase|nr:glutamine synthetase, type [Desulfomicrobiaceae bacterium]
MLKCKNSDDVIRAVREHGLELVELWFVDVLGGLKSFQVLPDELEIALEDGMGFDGSALEGFCRIEESDMLAKPDPTTFQLVTWRTGEPATGRMFCQILHPDGRPFEGDSRACLRRLLQRAARRGYTLYVGPELEFFLFPDAQTPRPTDPGGYFDAPPHDLGTPVRRAVITGLRAMGIDVEYAHHEVAPGQHEISLRYAEALRMADAAVTYRAVVKDVARQHGLYATFMPKPIATINGSGMHVHQSLFKNGRNVLHDASAPYGLSREGRAYVAGLLRYAPEFTAITNQWVNSYKRLIPGFEAPVSVVWACRNRSALVRIPQYKPNQENAFRVELRSPDPACNPYLAFACILAAGLKGMEENLPLPDPVEEDVSALSALQRQERGIATLPGSLESALAAMEASTLVRETLGEHIFAKFLQNKKAEWELFRAHVTDFERERYLARL